ncbi:MAG: carbohydrate porin [Candidatus Omnitrophota bacterium]|nr:carbohydrate porin [Candidatus Omnitrophota bacterium]
MENKILSSVILCLAIFAASLVYAAADDGNSKDVSSFNSWIAQDNVTGRWGGLRDKLEKAGVTISSNYVMDINGNPAGGNNRTATYSGAFYFAGAMDFEKIASIKGLALKVSNYLFSGQNLSADIGNFYWVQEVYANGNYYLGELDLSLSLLDDTFVFETGRLFAGDIFGVPPIAQYYLTSALNGRLGAIPSDVFFPHYNIAAWGVRATYQPNKEWHFIAGLYNADTSVSKTTNHGTNFNFDMDQGYLAVGQLTYKHGQDKKDMTLPGSASFGAYYESSKFPDLSSSKIWRGNYGFYWMLDQMIYKGQWPEYEGPSHMSSSSTLAERHRKPYSQQTAIPLDRPEGLTAWTGITLAPDIHINTQVYEIATGLIYQGLPPNRNRDVTAVCFVIGHFSEKLPGQSDEMIVEFNHRFQLGPWFYVTPDIQYIINPNGQRNIKPALVLGVEASLNF